MSEPKISLTEDAILDKIKKYKKLRLDKNHIETEMEAIKAELTAEMDIRGITLLEIEDNKVTLSEVSTTRFDSKQLEKEFPEMYKKYTNTTINRRFLIS